MDSLSATFAALADPTRRAILARLARGEASVTELAQPFDMSMRAVSKHLRVLENAGLVTAGRDGQRRPRSLNASRMRSAREWLDDYEKFWATSLDRLESYVHQVQTTKRAQGKTARKERRHAR
jgi:DNA-binding transcriptional ArsR family regulator